MDGALLDPDIARRALSWRDGKGLPAAPLNPGELPGPGVHRAPDAHVRATRDELVIQVDIPPLEAKELKVRFEEAGVLHVGYTAYRQTWYRRFDFDGAYEASRVRAWLNYGVLTLRVPRRQWSVATAQ